MKTKRTNLVFQQSWALIFDAGDHLSSSILTQAIITTQH